MAIKMTTPAVIASRPMPLLLLPRRLRILKPPSDRRKYFTCHLKPIQFMIRIGQENRAVGEKYFPRPHDSRQFSSHSLYLEASSYIIL